MPGSTSVGGPDVVAALPLGPMSWHHQLLPGELRDEPDGRRSARDWFVDVTMYMLALGTGAFVLGDTWNEHSTVLLIVDIALGLGCLALLWWRRSHPDEVGVITAIAS